MLTGLWVGFKVSAVFIVAGMLFLRLARPSEALWFKKRALPVIVALYMAGTILPSVWLYWILMGGFIAIWSRSRVEACCLYIIVILFSPLVGREIGAAGVYILAFDKWVVAAFGLTIAMFVHRTRGTGMKGWFDWPLWLVMILNLFIARSQPTVTSFIRAELTYALSFILPYYAFTRSLRRPEDLYRVVLTLAFSAFILSILAIYETRTRFLPYEFLQNHFGTSLAINPYSKQRGGDLRSSTSFPESTTFGLFLAMGFMAMLANRDAFRAKRYWTTALGVIAIGLYMANARSALIAVGIGLICYDIYRRRYQSLLVKTGFFGILYAVALLIAQFSTSFADRIGAGGGSASTEDYRHLLITRGMEEIRKHPLIGVTVDQAFAALADLRQGEGIVDFVNGYIYYGMVTGIPGMISLLLCFVLMAGRVAQNRARLREHRRLTEIGGVVFAIALFTMVTTFLTGFGSRSDVIFFLFAGIGSALSAQVVTRRIGVAGSVEPTDPPEPAQPPAPRRAMLAP